MNGNPLTGPLVAAYYQINPSSGAITFINAANRLANDIVTIIITSTGGYQDAVQRVTFSLQSECGPFSTRIIAPNIGESAQPANQYPDIMFITDTTNGVFTPTNPNCPI